MRPTRSGEEMAGGYGTKDVGKENGTPALGVGMVDNEGGGSRGNDWGGTPLRSTESVDVIWSTIDERRKVEGDGESPGQDSTMGEEEGGRHITSDEEMLAQRE